MSCGLGNLLVSIAEAERPRLAPVPGCMASGLGNSSSEATGQGQVGNHGFIHTYNYYLLSCLGCLGFCKESCPGLLGICGV